VAEKQGPFPTRLSETGLFDRISQHQVAAGVLPYSVNAAGWCDGASCERFIALPGDAQIGYQSGEVWKFPDGTAILQTLSLAPMEDQSSPPRRVETRVLLQQQGQWAGYSYRWNAEQSDALLVEKLGVEFPWPSDGESSAETSQPPWHVPSRAECMMCHSRAAGFVLGLRESQLNREHDYAQARDNQLRTLEHLGIFTASLPKPPAELTKLVDPNDATADLELRARAYLQVNCSVCHVAAGGGNSQMELSLATQRDRMNLLDARPQHDTFGIHNAMLVAPGDPERSILAYRVARRGTGQMPPLGTNRVDERGVKLLREWIGSLKTERVIVRQWQMEDLLPALDQLAAGRSLEAGRTAFRDTGCAQCHRFGEVGGTVGPDLAGVAKRLKPRDLLESILLPAKVIAEEYATHAIATDSGKVISGRIEREDDRVVLVRRLEAPDPPVEIAKSDIVERRRLDRSNMPTGTVDVLRQEQILDLLAYLLHGPGEGTAAAP
jgi:uncharacterized repeat protein (TIGR03806 family)